MPLYEFKCKDCGLIFEELVFYSDIKEVLCPKCSGNAERVLSTLSLNIPDEDCLKFPKGEPREMCTECKHGGGACPYSA